MTDFLKERIGEHEYKAPRMDGNQTIVIDESLIREFEELEATQFDCCNPYYKDRVWGLFGEQDTLAHFEPMEQREQKPNLFGLCRVVTEEDDSQPMFLRHYNNSYHFPGGHTPTEQEVKTWYAPLAQKILMEYSMREERFFRHLASPSSSSLGKT